MPAPPRRPTTTGGRRRRRRRAGGDGAADHRPHARHLRRRRPSRRGRGMERAMDKLPRITLAFWIMKICATTLGETAGDLFSMTLDLGYAASSACLLAVFAVVLVFQLLSTPYPPALYWPVILLTSTAGTTVSDFMDRTLALGYSLGSSILLALLLAVLATWRLTTGSLAVDRVRTRGVEVFYWIAILISNTLGTALGDFLAHDSGLGFGGGAALIGGLLAVIAIAYFLTAIPRVLLFWLAFILTRPFGATVGDVLTKTRAEGGLGFGTIYASLVLLTVLVIGVGLTIRDQRRRARLPAPTAASAIA